MKEKKQDVVTEENVTSKESENEKSPRAHKIAAIAGFSLAGLAVLALICTVLITFISANTKVTDAKISAFKNEKQITSKLKDVIKKSNTLYSTDAKYIKNAIDETDSSDASDTSMTLEQDTGNQPSYTPYNSSSDADMVKTDDKYIYLLNTSSLNKISIFTAKGKDSSFVTEIKISNKENETFNFKEFFLSGKKLIAVEQASLNDLTQNARAYTRVEAFDLSDIKNIKSTALFTQSGRSCSSKLLDNTLYVASVHHAANSKDLPHAVSGDGDVSDFIPAKDIYCVENPNEPNFMVVSEINLDNSEPAVTKAVLGSSGDIYSCGEHMYISSYEYNFDILKKENNDGSSYTHQPVDRTQLIKVDLKNKLNFASSAKIAGYTDSRYSFDENGDKLRVASTVTLDNDKFTESANIFVLDKDLKCVGKLTDFTSDRSIKAVRYIDDTAYVVSYRSTDPLIIIDLKNYSEPKVLTEKVLDGVSDMLVPVDDKTLLSIGYYTAEENSDDSDGLKLVTYDISNKTKPKTIDKKIFKGYESPAQTNLRALLVNSDRNDFVIPMIYEKYDEKAGKNVSKFGMLNFSAENGKIKIIDNYSSSVFTASDETYTSLDRCINIGDYVYLLGSTYNYYNTDGMALIEAVKYK